MSCSASLVTVDLVHQLFKSYKNVLAIVFSSKSLAPNWYFGKEKSMILSNRLFHACGYPMELTIDNDITKYFYDRIYMTVQLARTIAAMFGLTNSFLWPMDKLASNGMGRRFEMGGRPVEALQPTIGFLGVLIG